MTLALLCMSDDPDDGATHWFSRPRRQGSEADSQQEGHRGNDGETWFGYPKALREETQAPCLVWVIFVLVGYSSS